MTVRFTVHSDEKISASPIRTSNSHDPLDHATLELMERVAPLPKIPEIDDARQHQDLAVDRYLITQRLEKREFPP